MKDPKISRRKTAIHLAVYILGTVLQIFFKFQNSKLSGKRLMPHKAGSTSARRLLSKIPLTWWVSSFSLHIRITSGVYQQWRFLGYLPHHSSWGAVPGVCSFHEHCRQLTAGSWFLRTLILWHWQDIAGRAERLTMESDSALCGGGLARQPGAAHFLL